MTNIVVYLFALLIGMSSHKEDYVCTPCGSDCDSQVYHKPGECPVCGMKLVKKSSIHFSSISPEQVCGYLDKHPDVVILDVRTREEYEGKTDEYGTIKNAINIPIQELESRLGELDKYRESEIIVYCSLSKRSSRASYMLGDHGFSHVINMTGGISTMKDPSCRK